MACGCFFEILVIFSIAWNLEYFLKIYKPFSSDQETVYFVITFYDKYDSKSK
jgi:hypothetical protein